MSALTSIDHLDRLDFSMTVNMNGMFIADRSLTSLDLSEADLSNVTEMLEFCRDCKNLISVDLSTLDTSHLSTYEYLFAYDAKLSMIRLNENGALNYNQYINDPSGTWTNEHGTWIQNGFAFQNIDPVAPTQWYGRFGYIFNGNGATEGERPTPLPIPRDSTTTDLNAPAPSQGTLKRNGYKFLGWDPSDTATTATYPVGATLPRISSRTMLYAVWRSIPIPAIGDVIAPKSLGGIPVDGNDTVTVHGTLANTTSIDPASVHLLPAGNTSETDGDGIAATNVTVGSSRTT